MKFLLYISILSIGLSGSATAMTPPKIQTPLFQNIQADHIMFALAAATLGGLVLYQIYMNPVQHAASDSSSSDDSSYNSEDTHYHEVQTSYSTPSVPVEKEKKEETPANTPFTPFTYDSSDPELEVLAYLNNQ